MTRRRVQLVGGVPADVVMGRPIPRCADCGTSPIRSPRASRCGPCQADAQRRLQREYLYRKARKAGRSMVPRPSVCVRCRVAPTRNQGASLCAECAPIRRREIRRANALALKRLKLARVEQVIGTAHMRLGAMLETGEYDGNTIRAIGRALALVTTGREKRRLHALRRVA